MILGLPRPKPTNVAEWLEQATGSLVPSAQARVRQEIEAHYAEAVQAHLVKGLSEPAAQAAALTDLGNAPAAARRFGREHLTDEDARLATLWTSCGCRNPFLMIFLQLWLTFTLFLPKPRDLFTMDYRAFLLYETVAASLLLISVPLAIGIHVLARRKPNLRISAADYFADGRPLDKCGHLVAGDLWLRGLLAFTAR